ncbi:MAG: transglycosylase domain-containing protein [Actinomycetes bacterium]
MPSKENDSTATERAAARAAAKADAAGAAAGTGEPPAEPPKRSKPPRVVRWRVALILAGLGSIAMISLAFGALTAVSSDLPALESREEYKHSANSLLFDSTGKPLGVLTSPKNHFLVDAAHIAPAMKHAVISIEDRRFYENSGIDLRGMGRALVSDIKSGSAVQGASTITQQFVKNALEAADNRTVFQKLRESVLAYHLNRRWPKDKILSEYLNTIYFGQGAYGVESAARVYFGKAHPGCGTKLNDSYCAADLDTAEAALLAGVIASPTAFDPIAHPVAARQRRDTVLRAMRREGYITESEYRKNLQRTIPDETDITPPTEQTQSPYFSSWIRGLLVAKLGATRAYTGGLKIKTTIDLDLQKAAEEAVNRMLPADSGLPAAAVVAIENKTGAVRAMVGGTDYSKHPFNLATQGHRQPGSAIKPITLAAALSKGYSTGDVFESRRKIFTVPRTKGKEFFIVNNYDNAYAGSRSLTDAMISSDNSVYAELGIKVGTKRIARLANRMGIRTPVSTNYAVTLGGLKEGVSPLDMAHTYETFATGGVRVNSANGLGGTDGGPVGIESIRAPGGRLLAKNKASRDRVLSPAVSQSISDVLQQVVSSGTGKEAQIGGFAAGKTGTTENYGDAWFVGWNEKLTVAVWVGYPDRLKPMTSEFGGSPVAGGTFPASIWREFMLAANSILQGRKDASGRAKADRAASSQGSPGDGSGSSSSYDPSGGSGSDYGGGQDSGTPSPPPSDQGGGGGGGNTGGGGNSGGGGGDSGSSGGGGAADPGGSGPSG